MFIFSFCLFGCFLFIFLIYATMLRKQQYFQCVLAALHNYDRGQLSSVDRRKYVCIHFTENSQKRQALYFVVHTKIHTGHTALGPFYANFAEGAVQEIIIIHNKPRDSLQLSSVLRLAKSVLSEFPGVSHECRLVGSVQIRTRQLDRFENH